MFHHPSFDAHETVLFAADEPSGLRAIVAVHNTVRGPSLGGVRVWTYEDDDAAITDALRLSRAMSYKSAMADLPLGGGKAVVIVPSRGAKTEAMFDALGRVIERLDGAYIAAEDVGSEPADMRAIARHTRHVTGLAPEDGGRGDPSPTTAFGCFVAAKATAKAALGVDDVHGLHVALQGLGHVGYALARHLHAGGARLTVSDIDPARVARAQKELGAAAVAPEEIATVEADIFSPNALGSVLNETSIPALRVKAVCGGANNQLATPHDGEALMARGILYAPDYVVNAGGVIDKCGEYFDWKDGEVEKRVNGIGERLAAIFEESKSSGLPTDVVADRKAERLFARS
jgi:leucine dehydrogenase